MSSNASGPNSTTSTNAKRYATLMRPLSRMMRMTGMSDVDLAGKMACTSRSMSHIRNASNAAK